MSGIGDQGMMPEYVRPQQPDDDSMDEQVANPRPTGSNEDEEQSDEYEEQSDGEQEARG